jgi:sugar/nucleoside kinase (ribokinase family)
MSLLIVGTVAFDQIETPFGKTDRILGGAATYIGLAARYFTRDVRLVSVVGGDFPESTLQMLRDRHIDTEGIEVVPGGKSFFWSGRYHRDMNCRDTLTTELNVLAGFDPVLPPPYLDSRYVMLGNLTPGIQKKVLDQLGDRPELVCMDTMNFWMDTAWDDLLEVIRRVDVLTINEEEARQLSGEYSLAKAARKVLGMGPRYLIVKKGEHGAMLFSDSQVFVVPAMPLEEVVDPTGAGDTFAGGFMGYVASRGDASFETLKKGLVYGSVVASFCVERFGTDRLLDLSDDDINERLGVFSDMFRIHP